MAISLVQHKSGNASGSVTITPTSTATANNLIVITVGLVDTGSTITVPSGFTAVGTAATSGTTNTSQMYYKVAAGTETSYAVSKSGTANDVRVVVLEYSGTDIISPLDKTNTATSGGSAVTTLAGGSITPTVSNFVAVVINEVTSASNTWTSWTSSFVSEDNSNLHRQETGDLIVTGGSGSYSTTGTWSASGVATQVVANFKAYQLPVGVPKALNVNQSPNRAGTY